MYGRREGKDGRHPLGCTASAVLRLTTVSMLPTIVGTGVYVNSRNISKTSETTSF
jgi:hypothetical protein